jgi:hypothetical protein
MNSKVLEKAFLKYGIYKETGLDQLWITHSDILPKILKLLKIDNLSVLETGESIEGRSIFKIKIGQGTTRILVWSQMHGNESTATKAIFDLINFFTADDEFYDLKNMILNELEIHFIPMLNPDGAEKFIRENAIHIDLNRDALSFQSPESRILQKIKDDIKPEFCFNMHDQNRYYSVGRTELPPALSFLAPPSGYNNPANNARQNAMKIIVYLKSVLDTYIPDRIAKYSDDHEPRSFGDNFNRQESAVILIESGYLKNDLCKEKIREYNFISLLSAFTAISEKTYTQCSIADYSEIPENNEGKIFDLFLKGVKIIYCGNEFKIDIGINRHDLPCETVKETYTEGVIEGLGDLSTCSGHEIIDCSGLTANEGKILFNNINCSEDIPVFNPDEYFSDGYTTFACMNGKLTKEYCRTPFNITQRENINSHEIKTGFPANICLTNKKGIEYLIVNGFLMRSPFNKNLIRNGLIFH